MTATKEIIISICILVIFAATVIFFLFYGTSQRVYSEILLKKTIDEPFLAYSVWRESGVYGRALVLYDRKLNATPYISSLRKDNYVYLAVHNNIVRKIYHIIPDSSWEGVKSIIEKKQFFFPSGDIFRTTIDGTPLVLMRIKDLPQIRERVLLNINGDFVGEKELQLLSGLIKQRNLNADIVTVSGENSEEILQLLNAGS